MEIGLAEAPVTFSRAPQTTERLPQVTLRRFPYPYRCALAICSDLDRTPNARAYEQLLCFLNTDRPTDFGPGVRLECANSIYFDMDPGQFAYWNATPAEQEMIRQHIWSGHVDVLHSYGDNARTREAAARALTELTKHDCRITVWVDHSKAPTNFGEDIMCGAGDVPTSPAYHADLTINYGIRFVWRGRVTSVIGQDIPHTVRGLFSAAHPFASARTALKESAKHRLGQAEDEKYRMHARNRLCRPALLRDGSKVIEFLRTNPHWKGVEHADTSEELAYVLSPRILDRLSEHGGAAILYTHLGKFFCEGCTDLGSAVTGFRSLAARFHAGEILVTTTSRLLRYVTARDALRFDVSRMGAVVAVHIRYVHDAIDGKRPPTLAELQGITFATPGRREVEVLLPDGNPCSCQLHHTGDTTYAQIPWSPLVFPETAA